MKNFLIFLVLTIFFITSNSVNAYPTDTWWNSDWKYAKIINISENSGHDLFDFQILLKINYNESMQPDFDDLRFTYYNSTSDKETKIPYWIEEKIDGNYSKVWIKVPFLPANSSTIVKMHFGNENAESESNGSDVFLDFDDFEYADTPENHDWKIAYGNQNTVIETSTNYAKTGNRSLKIFDPYGLWTSNSFAVVGRNYVKSGAAEIWFRDIQGQNIRDSQVFMYKDNIYENEVIVGVSEINSPGKYGYRFVPEEVLHPSIFSRTNDWHKFTIAWNETDYRVYIDEKHVSSRSGGSPSKLQIGGYWDTDTSTYYWDSMKIRKFTDPEPTYTISDIQPPSPPEPPEPTVPLPTGRSIILTSSDFRNIISATPARLPLIVTDSLTPEVEKFIGEYKPDYIYTLGFSLGLNNSYQIEYSRIPELFFPNATQAVYAEAKDKAILGSAVAYYLGMPVIFERGSRYDILDFESMSADEIQDFYTEKLRENVDDTNYLVLANFDKEESALAGYLAGRRKGFIISIQDKTTAAISEEIRRNIEYFGNKGLFHNSLEYKKGEPLYLAILGGNDSIPFWHFPDIGFEIFNNKDGNILYSDIIYGDVNQDGMLDLAVGRLDGSLYSTSLNLARESLPRSNKTVLIGEYRYGKIIDALHMFGGMSQAWIADNLVLKGFDTKRIVEKRIESPAAEEDLDDVVNQFCNLAAMEVIKVLLGPVGALWSYSDKAVTVMYSIFEFDWKKWPKPHLNILPDHLPVISQSMNENISEADIVGYFGLGDKYWLVPPDDRNWAELYFAPYNRSDNFTEISFSGFLYDDHDISAASEIKKQVVQQGGSVLGSSGVIHDTYTTITSAFFFDGIASGKTLGEAFMKALNNNPTKQTFAVLYAGQIEKFQPHLYMKDVLERILFVDPAYRPVNNKVFTKEPAYAISRSNSFAISSEIESNYTIDGRKIIFFSADSYLMEQERPLIPMFVREFILPTGAAIRSVDVDLKYSQRYGLDKNIIYNDSCYTNYTAILIECFEELSLGNEPTSGDEEKIYECIKKKVEPLIEYPYPNESYWYKTQTLLDNRRAVYVYIPALLHRNRFVTKILEKAKIAIEYDSQLEMSVEANDIALGEDEIVKIKLINEGQEIYGDLFVWVEGEDSWNFTGNVLVPQNSSIIKEFALKPEAKGNYNVKVLFVSENMTIGPRLSFFEVGGIDFVLSKKFVPEEVRLHKKRYMPPVNFPEIRMKNTGILNITSIEITDEIPEGFHVPGSTSARRMEIENAFFDTDEKIPVFIFLVTEKESRFLKRDVKMLKRKFYNVTVSGDKISIEIGNFSRTNFGRDVGNNDVLLVKYLISSEKADKINSPGNMTTDTVANAFSDGFSSEKSTETKLLVK